MTTEQIKKYLGAKLEGEIELQLPVVSYDHILDYTTLPEQFDGRQQWGDFIHEIRDQGKCGSCWAFASSEILSDRYAIASNGQYNIVLSPQYQVSCDPENSGCGGAFFLTVWIYLQKQGTSTDECTPYTSSKGEVQDCPKQCVDGSDIKLYKIKGVKIFKRPEDAKLDILSNGPVYAGFTVYEDFIAYKSGIYKYTSGKFLGGHAVKVIGWGVENGIKYWIAANSWGSEWGNHGFFKIQEGECSFEGKLITGDLVL